MVGDATMTTAGRQCEAAFVLLHTMCKVVRCPFASAHGRPPRGQRSLGRRLYRPGRQAPVEDLQEKEGSRRFRNQGSARNYTPSPQKPRSGAIAGGAGSRMGPNGPNPNGDSDALFAAEVHSFPRGKLSADRPAFAVKILPGAAHASLDSRVRILYLIADQDVQRREFFLQRLA
jgi:hypothetical protein